jgi:hypothetical protein
MDVGEGQEFLDSRAKAGPNTMTPDGRFFYDGLQWHVVPLAPEVTQKRRGLPTALIWTLVVLAGVVGGAVIFEILVAVGLEATH